jgi:hypothetical protein
VAAAKLLVARTAFVYEAKTGAVHVCAGQVVAANDPAVKGRETLFEPAKPPTTDDAASILAAAWTIGS